MADTPSVGWYADPADASRLRYWDGEQWTDQVRALGSAAESPRPQRRLSRWAITGIVACALMVVGGITALVVQAGSADDTPSSSKQDSSSASAPPDWEVYTSRSGAIEYAYDPDWTDVLTPEYEDMMMGVMDSSGVEDIEVELAGAWILDGSMFSGETTLIVMAFDEGTDDHGPLDFQATSFVWGNTSAVGADDYDTVVDESFTTDSGLEAWRIDFTMMVDGEPIYSSVIVYEKGVTLGVVYVLSLKDFDFWISDFLAVANSVVVVKPPVSP